MAHSTEIFKTMVDLNPTYMKEIFERCVSNKRPVKQNYKRITLHPKQTKLDMELRTSGASHRKFRIHCKHQIL